MDKNLQWEFPDHLHSLGFRRRSVPMKDVAKSERGTVHRRQIA